MARAVAQDGIERYEPFTGNHAVHPFVRDWTRDDPALLGPPGVAFTTKRACQSQLALLVPTCTDGRSMGMAVMRALPGSGCSRRRVIDRRRILGAEHVQSRQARRVVRAGRTACVLQRATQLTLIQVFGIANGQDAHVERWVIDDVVAQLRCDGEAVEDQGLYILQDVVSLEGREDSSQRPRVETESVSPFVVG